MDEFEVVITENELNFDFKMPKDKIKCKEEFENTEYSDKVMLQTGECIKSIKTDDDVGTQRNNENMLDNSLYNINIKSEEINIKYEINEKHEQELHDNAPKQSVLIVSREENIQVLERNHMSSLDEKSNRKNDFKPHLLIHTREKNFKCKICEKSFCLIQHLKGHLVIHSGEKNFKCNICEKSFIRKSNLNKHLLIHSGEKNFMCNICEKSFIRKDVLKTHLKCHSDEKKFKCNNCEKSFTQKGYLSKHLIIHSSEKNFKCNICDKLFTRKGDLNKHLLIHSNEKNFKCNNCKKAYTRRSDLNRHSVIHLNKKK